MYFVIFTFPVLFLVLVLPFALFGIGFDTEITEHLLILHPQTSSKKRAL